MGNTFSTPAPTVSNFEKEELARLIKKFKKLDLDKSGTISGEEFMSVPEVSSNPLAQRVIDLFDEDGNGEVDFREFINTLSLFSVKSDISLRLKFAFRIYDMDNDGFISQNDIVKALKMMVGSNLTEKQLEAVCARAIHYADMDDDEKISFDEFCRVVEKMNVHHKMMVEV